MTARMEYVIHGVRMVGSSSLSGITGLSDFLEHSGATRPNAEWSAPFSVEVELLESYSTRKAVYIPSIMWLGASGLSFRLQKTR